MKKFLIVFLAILFFITPFIVIENKFNFEFFIIIWPIVAIIFIIIKIKNFNKIDFIKINSRLNLNENKDLEENNLGKKEENSITIKNSTEK